MRRPRREIAQRVNSLEAGTYLEPVIVTHGNKLSPNYASIRQLKVFPFAQYRLVLDEFKGLRTARLQALPHTKLPRMVVVCWNGTARTRSQRNGHEPRDEPRKSTNR